MSATKAKAKTSADQSREGCFFCGGDPPGSTLAICGGCRVARYCGADCQRAHWRNGHKKQCKSLPPGESSAERPSCPSYPVPHHLLAPSPIPPRQAIQPYALQTTTPTLRASPTAGWPRTRSWKMHKPAESGSRCPSSQPWASKWGTLWYVHMKSSVHYPLWLGPQVLSGAKGG